MSHAPRISLSPLLVGAAALAMPKGELATLRSPT